MNYLEMEQLTSPNRDRDLVNLLPDFLTVDITFVRGQAAKFYTRVRKRPPLCESINDSRIKLGRLSADEGDVHGQEVW
jgi:hypothetical protein